MKVNEAPEKIYVHVKKDKVTNTWNSTWVGVHDIEYIRKNAFIEKAENYLRNKCHRFILTEKDIEDFVNYMKGEQI